MLRLVFPIVVTLFCLLEIYAALVCLVDFRGITSLGENALPGGIIETVHEIDETSKEGRAMIFLALWVGSNQLIMVLLLIVILICSINFAQERDRHILRLSTSIAMVLGILFYYLLGLDENIKLMRQHGELTERDSDNNQPEQINFLMQVILIPSFKLSALAEAHLIKQCGNGEARAAMQTDKDFSTKKSR